MRYIVAGVGFALVWLMVAVLTGAAMVHVFPPQRDTGFVGIGFDWRNLPGTLLGILAGIHSWRASLRAAEKKDEERRKKVQKDPPTTPAR
jgi:hypothetical protein